MIYGIQRDEAGDLIGVIRFFAPAAEVATTDARPANVPANAAKWATAPTEIFPREGRQLWTVPRLWVEPSVKAGELFTLARLAEAVEAEGKKVLP